MEYVESRCRRHAVGFSDTRAEIDAIQSLTISKLIPKARSSFLSRAAIRIEEEFFGQPWSQKVKFLKYALTYLRYTTGIVADRIWAWTVRRRIAASLAASAEGPALRVAVHGTGSIGDFLTHVLFVAEFYKAYGPMTIDFYCHPKKVDDAKFIFANAGFVKNVITVSVLPNLKRRYDLIVYLRYLVKYEIVNYQKILTTSPDLFNTIEAATKRFASYEYIFDRHPFLDGLFARHVGHRGMNLAEVVGYLGNLPLARDAAPFLLPDAAAYDVMAEHRLERKRYITVHHGFDVSHVPLSIPATKCWQIEHWQSFVRLFKAQFPDVLVVQLGAFNSAGIAGIDVDLVGRTTLAEAAWVIKQALFHVDGESGLVRMAQALHTRSIVLFGPTSPSFFSFGRNINLVSNACGDCWWSTHTWMSRCPRGLDQPECMTSITPDQVMAAASDLIARSRAAPHPMLVAATLHDRVADPDWISAFVASALQGIGGEPMSIAEIGLGSEAGQLSAALAAQGHRAALIYGAFGRDELSSERRFMQRCAENGVEIRYGSILNMTDEDGTYDVVLAPAAIDRVERRAYALKEMLRVVKPGGHLLVTVALTPAAGGGGADAVLDPKALDELLAGAGIGGSLLQSLDRSAGVASGSMLAGLTIRNGA